MTTVTVSPKYQIVIPEQIRKQMGIKPGMKMEFICIDNRIHLVPVPSIEEMRGFLKGSGITFEREEEDRI